MVITEGNSIIGAFTGGSSVNEIYTYGEKVWPESEPQPGEYYIKWWPKDLSGSFTIGSETRWLQDYNGYYSGPFLDTTVISGYSTIHLKTLDSSAFMSTGVIGIETNLERFASNAFTYCSSLLFVRASKLFWMDHGVFGACQNLYYVSVPELYSTKGAVFKGCSRLGTIDLPNINILYAGAFSDCINLYEVSAPKCRWLGPDIEVFYGCYNLKRLELPSLYRIDGSALQNNGLNTLVLASNSVVSLGAIFSGTGISSSTGSIYDPLSLVSEYKSATGWSYYSKIIYPIPHE